MVGNRRELAPSYRCELGRKTKHKARPSGPSGKGVEEKGMAVAEASSANVRIPERPGTVACQRHVAAEGPCKAFDRDRIEAACRADGSVHFAEQSVRHVSAEGAEA